jgi:hypothetical protein
MPYRFTRVIHSWLTPYLSPEPETSVNLRTNPIRLQYSFTQTEMSTDLILFSTHKSLVLCTCTLIMDSPWVGGRWFPVPHLWAGGHCPFASSMSVHHFNTIGIFKPLASKHQLHVPVFVLFCLYSNKALYCRKPDLPDDDRKLVILTMNMLNFAESFLVC